MRRPSSLLAACGLAIVSTALLVRSSHAEPPPQLETRDAKEVLKALLSSKADRTVVASVRWFVEVAHGEQLEAPVGGAMTEIGAWGDHVLLAESTLGTCEPLSAADAATASKLLTEYGTALPPLLRGYALSQQRDLSRAQSLFTSEAKASLPSTSCPSEHPMYSHRRIDRLGLILGCLKRWSPKGNHSAIEKLIERARSCAANNHAVG
jgi:hypothetical protein